MVKDAGGRGTWCLEPLALFFFASLESKVIEKNRR